MIAYGLDEAREAIAKDDDRRTIAKRERQLARMRKENPGNRNHDALAGKCADELAFVRDGARPGRKRRQGEAVDAWARRRSSSKAKPRQDRVTCSPKAKVTRTESGALVRAWEGKFEREVLRKLGGELRTQSAESAHYRDLHIWLRHQPALIGVGDDIVSRLAGQMRERWRVRWLSVNDGGAAWRPWRKGRMKAGTVCG